MKGGILLVVLLVALAFGGSAFASGGDKPKPPGGGDKPKPSGGKKTPKKPKGATNIPDDDWIAIIPDWFNQDGNSFWVDPECRFVLQDANALCADIPPAQRSSGLAWWLDNFSQRIAPYVYETIGGIPFGDANA